MNEHKGVCGDAARLPKEMIVEGEATKSGAGQDPELREATRKKDAESGSGAGQLGGKGRFLARLMRGCSSLKGKDVFVPPDLGVDPSLGEGRGTAGSPREKRNIRYERKLMWEHGGNLAMLTVPGLLGVCVWALWVMVEYRLDYYPEVFFSRLMDIRRAGRQCLVAAEVVGAERLNHCPFGMDASVSTGITLVASLFTVECGVVAVLGFRVRASVRRSGGSAVTIGDRVLGAPGGALLFWLAMYCLWVPMLGACLLWTPDVEMFLERPLLVLVESVWPMWVVVAASIVVPIWLYGHTVEYVLEDVGRRRREIWWDYGRTYCAIRSKVASDREARDAVRKYGKAARVGRWFVFGAALLVTSLLVWAAVPLPMIRVIGLLSFLAMLDAFCVRCVAYAWSWGKAGGGVMIIVALLVGGVLVLTTTYLLLYALSASTPVVFALRLILVAALVFVWLVVVMFGLEDAKHPLTVTRARRVMRRSDELVWLRDQEGKIAVRENNSGSIVADLGAGNGIGSDRLREGRDPVPAPKEADRALVAAERSGGGRESASAEKASSRVTGHCGHQQSCGGIIALAGVLLVLGAGQLKAARRR
ncbi:hypothetical protein [Actinomyces wuliandei]|uniref:hypothetical protein n=1 Tax=Actinomyces wuliandei TaxID=2057743 RepID=UPI000FD82956|nr:hypothetical protein [Actinomyces wuliandei]